MACVTQLVSALRNDTPEKATWTKLCEIIDGRFKEDLGFAKETIALLWKTINQSNETSTTMTPNNPPPVCLFFRVEANSDLPDSLRPLTRT